MEDIDWGKNVSGRVSAGDLGSITYSVQGSGGAKAFNFSAGIADIVRRSASGLLASIQSAAPTRTGALRQGLLVSPQAERSATPGKVVYDIFPDPAKNDVFAKYTRSGKRYYYPASMEYGFRLVNGNYYPGKYYMRDSSIRFEDVHEANVVDGINRMLEEVT